MGFEKIDRNSWKRNEYFEHYFTNVPCTYSMTVKLDITQIKEKRLKLYPAMLYYLATIVNRHSEFRTAINQAGELGIYDEMMPSYTIFHEDTETFVLTVQIGSSQTTDGTTETMNRKPEILSSLTGRAMVQQTTLVS